MRRIESALQPCMVEVAAEQDCSIIVTSYGTYCSVLVKTANQTRRKIFLMRPVELAAAVPAWLRLYPFR